MMEAFVACLSICHGMMLFHPSLLTAPFPSINLHYISPAHPALSTLFFPISTSLPPLPSLLSPPSSSSPQALGEQVLREVFPDATIMRPANVFGAEDRFLNYYASMYIVHGSRLPLCGARVKCPMCTSTCLLCETTGGPNVLSRVFHTTHNKAVWFCHV